MRGKTPDVQVQIWLGSWNIGTLSGEFKDFQIVVGWGESPLPNGVWKIGLLLGGGNLRRSDFDHSNLFQS